MRALAAASAALLATTAMTHAGGIERNAFTTGILFEEGDYIELGFTSVSPSVTGTITGAPVPSGDMAPAFNHMTLSYHNQFSDQLSFALVIDEPVGADVAYPVSGYPFTRSDADLNSRQITAALRYVMPNNVSVYGGLRLATVDGTIFVSTPAFSYALDAESDYGLGYMIGAAYERPDIALRVALTYFSEVDLDVTGLSSGTIAPAAVPGPLVNPRAFGITLPDSLLLEAQTGVAEGTLVFGSIRWVDWSEFDITPGDYAPGALVSYADDTITYTLGVARRLNEDLVLLGSVNYEPQNGGFSSNLGPTDGRLGVGLGARYSVGQWELSGGINYTWIGDANTIVAPGPVTSTFADNTAVGVGFRVGYRF